MCIRDSLDGTQLAAFLSAYASGEITLPQPEATYPAEQEDNDNGKNVFLRAV